MSVPDTRSADRGGAAALRGFRLQSLYVLHRTLGPAGTGSCSSQRGLRIWASCETADSWKPVRSRPGRNR